METIQPNTAAAKNNLSLKKRQKSKGVDLTPMVDLGFLLITFFMFSTILASPKAVKLRMPQDEYSNPTLLNKNKTMVILADSTSGYYLYEPVNETIQLQKMSSIEMVRNTLLAKKKNINTTFGKSENLNVVLKLHQHSRYEKLMQLLDEMTINAIEYYILDKLNQKERKAIREMGKKVA